MVANNTIYPLLDHSQGPLEGEDVLASMLQWGTQGDRRSGSLAGLIELNWAVNRDLGHVYDKAVSGRQKPMFSLTVEQAMEMLGVLEREGQAPEMIFFTGEDPAGHPQLGDFVELARQKGIAHVGLQCSGPRIAHDDHFLEMLVRLKPLLFVEFDGFDETASLILHGRRDLPFEAKRGLDRLASAGLTTALLASVAQGVNLQEVGAIAAFGLKHPAVFSAIFRPLPTRLNRFGAGPQAHVTAAGIMSALEQQSDGFFRRDSFAPAMCCQPERHFYAQVPYSHQNGSPADPALEVELPANGHCDGPNGASCFWLGVHEFMTPWSKDARQGQRCPLVIMMPDGRTIPYCLYNAAQEE